MYRVILDFSNVDGQPSKFVWFALYTSKFPLIKDLKVYLCKKFGLENIELYVKDALLQNEDTIDLLRDEDIVKILGKSTSIPRSSQECEDSFCNETPKTLSDSNVDFDQLLDTKSRKRKKKHSDGNKEFITFTETHSANQNSVTNNNNNNYNNNNSFEISIIENDNKRMKNSNELPLGKLLKSSQNDYSDSNANNVCNAEVKKKKKHKRYDSEMVSSFCSSDFPICDLSANKTDEISSKVVELNSPIKLKNNDENSILSANSRLNNSQEATSPINNLTDLSLSNNKVFEAPKYQNKSGFLNVENSSSPVKENKLENCMEFNSSVTDNIANSENNESVTVLNRKVRRRRRRKRKQKIDVDNSCINSVNTTLENNIDGTIFSQSCSTSKVSSNCNQNKHVKFDDDSPVQLYYSNSKTEFSTADKTVKKSTFIIQSQLENRSSNKTIESENSKTYQPLLNSQSLLQDDNYSINNKQTQDLNSKTSRYLPLTIIPTVGTCIAYKVLELNELYCPEVSEYKEGRVKNVDSQSNIEVEFFQEKIKQPRFGKFELTYSDDDEIQLDVTKTDIVNWSNMIDPQIITM